MTDLGVFATTLHENVHAMMFYQLNRGDINIETDDVEFSVLADAWSEAVAMKQNNGEVGTTTLGYLQHDIMADLINEMAKIVKEYSDSKGYGMSEFESEALMWMGLQSSVAWATMEKELRGAYELIFSTEIDGFAVLKIGKKCDE